MTELCGNNVAASGATTGGIPPVRCAQVVSFRRPDLVRRRPRTVDRSPAEPAAAAGSVTLVTPRLLITPNGRHVPTVFQPLLSMIRRQTAMTYCIVFGHLYVYDDVCSSVTMSVSLY